MNKIKIECPVFFDIPNINKTSTNDANIIICNPCKIYNISVLKKLNNLKVIATPSTGVNHIDKKYCNDNFIKIYSLLDDRTKLNTISASAEFTWGLIIATSRNLHLAINYAQSGYWRDKEKECRGVELQGKTIGIIGMGRIGRRILKYAHAFDMTPIYYDPYTKRPPVNQIDNIYNLAKMSDIISINPYLTSETHEMIDEKFLTCCKQDAIIVNTSRGEVVNEIDIANFVKVGKIHYATDVLQNEGRKKLGNSPLIKLARKNKIIVTPHIAGATLESQKKAFDIIIDILRRDKWI